MLVTALVVGGCAADGRSASVRTDSAGVEIVRYTGEGRLLPDYGREAFQLGGNETDPHQSFFQVYESTVATDANGNIYILELSDRRVIVFDRSRARWVVVHRARRRTPRTQAH